MAQVETRSPGTAPRAGETQPPSVLVVLVVRDGAPWLRQCLMALSRQTYRRISVLAVDNASADGSRGLLESALGADRVLKSETNLGFAGAVGLALRSEVAERADYLLFLHDDTVLDPGAVAALLEAAQRVGDVGVVGPKVVDWDQPRVLREIGLSTDRFGYAYSPLEEEEIDQGQYDRIREVLYVSSCAMLVSKDAWTRIGPPDERLSPLRDDLDFCWRARIAGFRVLMSPKALARHRGAAARGERPDALSEARMRYHRERAALASVLKNYGLLSLLWILPLHLVQTVVRTTLLVASRRFEDAYQVLAAWGWNVAHLPSTLRRRRRAQAARRVPDRSVRRSMAPTAIRIRRWALSAAQSLLPTPAEGEEAVSPRRRVLGFARTHPVATAWALAVLVGAVSYRNLFTASSLIGPGLPAFPGSPADFFRELLSGVRHTGLGGGQAASPALGVLGLGSVLTLGEPSLLAKILLLALPGLAAVTCYRAIRGHVAQTLPAAVGAACYGLSSLVLWSLSEGRIPSLVLVAGVPWLVEKLSGPFEAGFRGSWIRWVVGAGTGLAVLASFYPGALLAGAAAVIGAMFVPLPGTRRSRGALLGAGALVLALVLLFPIALGLLGGRARGLMDLGGDPRFGALIRLSVGSGPGSWPTGFFLPLAAAVSLVFVSGRSIRTALRSVIAVVLCVHLAWFAAAGYLPVALSNPVAYLAVAAFGLSLLVAIGLTELLREVAREAFGSRQLALAAMGFLLAVGLAGQALQAAGASWAVGRDDRIPPAYAIVSPAGEAFRVLWLGGLEGDAFDPPGGLPDGTVQAGAASVRYAVRDGVGASALDVGRPASGPGYDALVRGLQAVLAGETRHGGALLAPFAIRFVVARPADLPPAALRRLARQLDLDPVPAGGLTIFQNAKAPPVDSAIGDAEWRRAAVDSGPLAAEELPVPGARRMGRPGPDSFTAPAVPGPSLLLLSQQFDARWRLRLEGVEPAPPSRAFGWATGFAAPAPGGSARIVYTGQRIRTAEMALLAVLWAAALWALRRPSGRG